MNIFWYFDTRIGSNSNKKLDQIQTKIMKTFFSKENRINTNNQCVNKELKPQEINATYYLISVPVVR